MVLVFISIIISATLDVSKIDSIAGTIPFIVMQSCSHDVHTLQPNSYVIKLQKHSIFSKRHAG